MLVTFSRSHYYRLKFIRNHIIVSEFSFKVIFISIFNSLSKGLTLSASTSEMISLMSLPSCMLNSWRACSSSSMVMYLIMTKKGD